MNKLTTSLRKAGLNGFFVALLSMVLLAWLFPSFGTKESPFPFTIITEYGVALIFFFYGVRLSPEKLKAGLGNWKLHLVIQSTTFILFPVIALLAYHITGYHEQRLLWLGIFYLAALPSTVSSSVVMVSVAGGNLPAAIFNASLSSIIGIFITPLWMSLFIGQTTESIDLSNVVLKLCLQVLLPVIAGFLFHGKLGRQSEKYSKTLRLFDQMIILLIVYTAFCESFAGNMFSAHSSGEILLLAFTMLLFFLFIFLLMQLVAVALKFLREDRITILFCGSKKSLVQGAVMGKVLFPDAQILGIILLPIMFYHALQLIAGSVIAQRMGNDELRMTNDESAE